MHDNAPSRGLNIGLWVVQVLLAGLFVMGGGFKLIMPTAELAKNAGGMPVGLIRFAGVAEVMGALGLILPAATRILPWLTPLAACGLGTIMVLAAGLHVSRGEIDHLPMIAVLAGLIAFVAWGRYAKAPVSAH